MSNYTQDEHGNWAPAEPIGWREEHNLIQRLLLWALRRPHCRDAEACSVDAEAARTASPMFENYLAERLLDPDVRKGYEAEEEK